MHIPDGFLSAPVSVTCAGLSTVAVGAATFRSRGRLGPRAVAMVGVTAAFVFAAQMINFPVVGGTSGHLVGGVLAAVLVGPSSAIIVMTAVLALQCLVFGDGGLLALGANVLNMAVVQPLVGFAIYTAILGHARPGRGRDVRRIAGVAFAGCFATLVAAATCAGELALSRVVAPALVLPAMISVHVVVGVGEAVITGLVIAALVRLRPELLDRARASWVSPASSIVVPGLAAALALALFVTPFACPWPDGLERVVERLGISPSQARISIPAPLRGYVVPGLGGASTTAAAALVGTLLASGLCVVLGLCLAPRSARSGPPERPS
jgi:cobalt/nickel transport system permease protein